MKKHFTRSTHRESGGAFFAALKKMRAVIAEAVSSPARGKNGKGFTEGKTPIFEEIRVFRHFPRILKKIGCGRSAWKRIETGGYIHRSA